MANETVLVHLYKILQTSAYAAIILGTEEKKIAIYTEKQVGKQLHNTLSNDKNPRPLTHDFIHSLFKGLEVKLLQVSINHREEGVYFARVFLEQALGETKQILEIDTRPSDALLLASWYQVPILCEKELFAQAIPFE